MAMVYAHKRNDTKDIFYKGSYIMTTIKKLILHNAHINIYNKDD